MKRTGSVILVILGVALILFGLLFLLGAAGQWYRYVTAGVALSLGAVLTGLGIRFFKQVDMIQPAYIRAEIMDMASLHNGEISEDDIRAKLGRRFPHAGKVLQDMRREGICQERRKNTAFYYVFPEILPRLTVRRCEFCDAELPLDEQVDSCPNCGGTIKTEVEKLSLSKDGHYSMDE